MNKIKIKKTCRICESKKMTQVLDLGSMPPANNFLQKKDFKNEEKFPLAVYLCKECKALQLLHVVNPKILFKNYHYETSASSPLVGHFQSLADEIAHKYLKTKKDMVIEIGSNDGVLLSRIKDKCRVLGIDPAENIAKKAIKNGVPTEVGFFDNTLAKKIKKNTGEAKVIVANNVMAHIDDLKSVFLGVKHLLSKDGKFIFEVHWLGNLMTEGGFDQIYHEHLCYHSLHSIQVLLHFVGMYVHDIKLVPIHGKSMRVYVGLHHKNSHRVEKFLKMEEKMGLTNIKTFQDFSKKIKYNKDILLELLNKLKKEGKKIVGYGAPAKGNTLLNYFGINDKFIDYIIDTTPSKQGMYTPGTHIKVVHPNMLRSETPDYVLLLSWNYEKAILNNEKDLRKKGVKFIIPVPNVRVV